MLHDLSLSSRGSKPSYRILVALRNLLSRKPLHSIFSALQMKGVLELLTTLCRTAPELLTYNIPPLPTSLPKVSLSLVVILSLQSRSLSTSVAPHIPNGALNRL